MKESEQDSRYGFLLTGLTGTEMNEMSKEIFSKYKRKNNIKTRVLIYTPVHAKNDIFMSVDIKKMIKKKNLDLEKHSIALIIKDQNKYKEDFDIVIKEALKEMENEIKEKVRQSKTNK